MGNHSHLTIIPNLLPKSDPRYQKWLASLRKRPLPWNKGQTKKTHPSVLKISNTFHRKKLDNFARWRIEARAQKLIPNVSLPLEQNANLAFLVGLILGDGNIYQFPRTQCLRIVLSTDKPLLIEYSRQVLKQVLKKEPTVRQRKNAACVDLCIYQNSLSQRLGVPSGSRGNLPIKLPSWIWGNNQLLIACLKGLFEAEGSYSVHLKTCTYNLSFSNCNVSLLDEVERALKILGLHPERRYNAVRLRKRAEATSFIELIRFRKYNST